MRINNTVPAPGARHTTVAIVEAFTGHQHNLRLLDLNATEEFYQDNHIRTRLHWHDPRITVSIRRLVEMCRPGDVVEYEFETVDRRNGRGIRGVNLRVIQPPGDGTTESRN